jgi:LysM repeat protein
VKDADRFELCGEACLASALGLDAEPIVVWLRQHEGGERAVHSGTSTQVLIDYCRSRGISARVVRGPAAQYVAGAVGRGHYALVVVWSDHQGNPVTRNQSVKLHVGGIGHWLLGYGTAGPQVHVMQPWGGRIVSYDLSHGQDQQLGIEIDRDVRSRPSPSPSQSLPGPPSPHVYVVKPGDTLDAIARREHVTLARLLGANPGIKNKNLIFPGQRIAVPN